MYKYPRTLINNSPPTAKGTTPVTRTEIVPMLIALCDHEHMTLCDYL